jgi:hypothetical protein
MPSDRPPTNRLKVYYPYRCSLCERKQFRGSRAQHCGLPSRADKSRPCVGYIVRLPGKARTRPPRLFTSEAFDATD